MGHQFKGLRHSGDPEVIPRVSSPHREANACGMRWRMGNPSLKIHRGAILSRWRDSDGFYLHFFPLVLLHVHFSSTHHKEFAPSWEGRTEGEAPVCMTPMWAWNLPVRATGQALCLDGLCSPEPGTEWLPSAGRPVDIRALRVARWCSEGRSPWAAGVREVPRGSGQV